MGVFVTFITNNWRVFAILLIEIVSFVTLLCTKKVKINDVFESVLMVLPDFISLAEKKFSDGASKYSFVFNKCVEMLQYLTHRSNEEILNDYTANIDHAIENILSTPQKKER